MNKPIRYIVIAAMLIMPMTLAAQKKQINQARDILKEGKEPQKAEQIMRELLGDSTQKKNLKAWSLLANAMMMEYEQINEKLYLKQEVDTVAFFNLIGKMFTEFQTIDSIDALPDRKHRVAPRYRERHSQYLNLIRPNLNTAGKFHMKKQDYAKALEYFNIYMHTQEQPLFQKFNYETTDTIMPAVACQAMTCAYYLNDDDKVIGYSDMALKDTVHAASTLRMLVHAYKEKKQYSLYRNTLQKGFRLFPDDSFFFTRLADSYYDAGEKDSAMMVVDSVLAADSTNHLARYARSTILLNEGRYQECIDEVKALQKLTDSVPDADYNVALAYFNQAQQLESQLKNNPPKRSQRHQIKRRIANLYAQSLVFMTRYRDHAPENVYEWAQPLYVIYLNLNMGKEFEEISNTINEYYRNTK